MIKIYIVLSVLILMCGFVYGQEQIIEDKSNNIDSVIVMSFKGNNNTNLRGNETEVGFYVVKKIDVFDDFYLIFIEGEDTKRTIYSEKNIKIKGIELKVDSVFYFELICKDTLDNGMCVATLPNVTYFGKYQGYELGSLKIEKNLNGLILRERPAQQDKPR